MVILVVFTSFYAGLNSVFERDLKKLIALSTLSHLGFIGLSLFSGLIHLAFFHLLTHALFKSLLFMAIGDVITCLAHSQDIRYLSSGSSSTPISSSFILVSILNLLGLPAIRGFFSKDLVLEIINFSNSSNLILFIVYFNVILTFFYSLQLVFFGGQSSKLAPIGLIHSTLTLHTISLFIVIVISICFGVFYVETLTDSILFIRLNSVIKRIPLFLIGIIVISLTLLTHQIKSNSIIATRFFSRIILLRTVTIPVLSHKSVLFFSYLTKTSETGTFSNQLNITLPRILL